MNEPKLSENNLADLIFFFYFLYSDDEEKRRYILFVKVPGPHWLRSAFFYSCRR